MLYLPVLNIFLGYYKLTKLITTLRLRLRAGPGAGAGSSALPWRHMRFQHCQLPLLGLDKETERGKEEAGLAWSSASTCTNVVPFELGSFDCGFCYGIMKP